MIVDNIIKLLQNHISIEDHSTKDIVDKILFGLLNLLKHLIKQL